MTIHVHPVNHRVRGERKTPSLLCRPVRSESGCSHSIDKASLLDATSTDTLQLISLIHLDVLAQLKQTHCRPNATWGDHTSTGRVIIKRVNVFSMAKHHLGSSTKKVPLRVFTTVYTKPRSVVVCDTGRENKTNKNKNKPVYRFSVLLS